jgi:hypothetical protein
MNEEGMLKPALIGGVALGIFSVLPVIGYFNFVCCAWVIGGGLLAAHLYVKASPAPVTLGRGVALGSLTGLIGSIVYILFCIPLYLMMKRSGVNLGDLARQSMERWIKVMPEMRNYLQNASAQTDIGLSAVLFGVIFTIGIFCLFAMLGGAVGVAVFEKRRTGAPPDDAGANPPAPDLPPSPPPDIP